MPPQTVFQNNLPVMTNKQILSVCPYNMILTDTLGFRYVAGIKDKSLVCGNG